MRAPAALIAAALVGANPALAADAKPDLATLSPPPGQAELQRLHSRAASGDAAAQRELGDLYRIGRGVPADPRAAEDWYRRAAEAGDPEGADAYGLMLFRNGRQRDAMPWIIKSAERGEPRAQYVYGTALFNGDFAEQDWVKAYAMMTRAARAGIDAATNSLAQMNRYIPAGQRREGLVLADRAASSAPPPPVRIAARTAAPVPPPPPPRRITEVDIPASNPPPPLPARLAPPAPSPAPAPARPAAGDWAVQLGAFGDQAKARALWSKLAALPEFAALEPRYEAAGALTRLRAGPLPARGDAEKLCAAAKARGQACFPLKP